MFDMQINSRFSHIFFLTSFYLTILRLGHSSHRMVIDNKTIH